MKFGLAAGLFCAAVSSARAQCSETMEFALPGEASTLFFTGFKPTVNRSVRSVWCATLLVVRVYCAHLFFKIAGTPTWDKETR